MTLRGALARALRGVEAPRLPRATVRAGRERGQDIVEYGLIVAVFAVMASVGGVTLSHAEKGYFAGLQSVTNSSTITFLSTPANPTSSTAAQFTFTSSYLIATFTCSITGSTSSACNPGAAWPSSPVSVGEGLRTISVTGTFSGAAASGSHQWVVDLTNPKITGITLPASGRFYNAAGWSAGCGFCGGATDPLAGSPAAAAGVQQVQLQIKNNATSQYWTGTGWSATATWVAASGTTG